MSGREKEKESKRENESERIREKGKVRVREGGRESEREPIKANPSNMTCRGSHTSGKLCTTLLLCFSFHTHITAGSRFSEE